MKLHLHRTIEQTLPVVRTGKGGQIRRRHGRALYVGTDKPTKLQLLHRLHELGEPKISSQKE